MANVMIGNDAGRECTTGSYNVYIGSACAYGDLLGESNVAKRCNGDKNVMIGLVAGRFSHGDNNTYIGTGAGYHIQGDYNISIGPSSGPAYKQQLSHRLYIDSSNSGYNGPDAFIYGDMTPITGGVETRNLTINANLTLNGTFTGGSGLEFGTSSIPAKGTFGSFTSSTARIKLDLPLSHNSGLSISQKELTSNITTSIIGIGSGISLQTEEGNEYNNTFYGYNSGNQVTNGINNTYIGTRSGENNITGSNNTLIGFSSGINNKGNGSTIVGSDSGNELTNGDNNSLFGLNVGGKLSSGSYNTLLGSYSGSSLTTESNNVMIGNSSGYKVTGEQNTYIGSWGEDMTSIQNRTGNKNTYIGYKTGYNQEGDGNIFIGNNAGGSISSESNNNQLYIDNHLNDYPLIYGDMSWDLNTGNHPRYTPNRILKVHGNFFVDSINPAICYAGWSQISDKKYKRSIIPFNTNIIDKICKLKPSSFKWINNNKDDIGFIAQELEEILPLLINKDIEGILSIDYSKLSVYTTKAIQEQQNNLNKLKEELNKEKNERLKLEEFIKNEINKLKEKL